ncbi:ROK family protein, partial [Streptomyces sp. SID4985]|uniref:ROK family protein n=3 Tax=unclassified Streptomyces TaxID=2593676 RepID=UPI0013685812
YASAAAVGEAWARVSGRRDADAADCAKAVAGGDRTAERVWQDAVDALADGLVTALTLLDPGTLIIGGGLAEAGETLFRPLREAVRRRITFQTPPTLVPAALGDTAGCLGAGLLARDLLGPAGPGRTDPSEVTA